MALPTSGTFMLGNGFPRYAHGIHSGGNAAIDSHLKDGFPDFILGQAIVECGADMQLQLMGPVERTDHADVQEAAIPPREPGTRPDITPAIAG